MQKRKLLESEAEVEALQNEAIALLLKLQEQKASLLQTVASISARNPKGLKVLSNTKKRVQLLDAEIRVLKEMLGNED